MVDGVLTYCFIDSLLGLIVLEKNDTVNLILSLQSAVEIQSKCLLSPTPGTGDVPPQATPPNQLGTKHLNV